MNQGDFWIVNSPERLESFIKYLRETWPELKYMVITVSTEKTRTSLQNNSLHKWCRMVAQELNDRGITFEQFFKPGFELSWSEEIVKREVFKPVLKAMTSKESTADGSTTDYPKVYEVLNKKLSEHGIHVPWPTKGND
jgi:hypothetical protein